jgi:uncharacterized protein (TIGR02118 family)
VGSIVMARTYLMPRQMLATVGRVIRLISLLRRKPGTTHDEFLAHWRGTHGPLIANSSAARYVRRYEQFPAAWPPAGNTAPEPDFDGVTVQEFNSIEAFLAHTSEPDFPAMQEDVARFLDTERLEWVIVEAGPSDVTVVIDRETT